MLIAQADVSARSETRQWVAAKNDQKSTKRTFRSQNSPMSSSYLNWPVVQQRMKMLATRGVSQSNINATKLRGFAIPLPPLVEQDEIAALLGACDRKITALEREIFLFDELFRAMLEELMSGRLSTQPLIN